MNNPSSNLSPPPKFASQSTGQGPATVDDWMQFIRWLYQLYGKAVQDIGATQSIAFNAPPQPALSADAIVAQAQVIRQGPVPGRAASESMLGAPPPPQHANELDALVTLALARAPQRNPSLSSLVIEDTHANRLLNFPATSYPIGTLFWETDRTVWYLVALVGGVNVWIWTGGMFSVAQSALPTDLGMNDASFRAYVSDYAHVLMWTGSAWMWAPEDDRRAGEGPILREVDPSPSTGWHLYDGSTVNYLLATGSLGSITLPDLTSVAANAAYPKAGSPNSGPNAAVATGANLAYQSVQGGSGTNVAFATHSHTPGEPRNLQRRPFFRM